MESKKEFKGRKGKIIEKYLLKVRYKINHCPKNSIF